MGLKLIITEFLICSLMPLQFFLNSLMAGHCKALLIGFSLALCKDRVVSTAAISKLAIHVFCITPTGA
jgi:hypothetical protein